MANISIRKLDKVAYKQLQIRATAHSWSMEEEVRQIIYKAVSTPNNISSIFKKHFGVEHGVDLDILNHQDNTRGL